MLYFRFTLLAFWTIIAGILFLPLPFIFFRHRNLNKWFLIFYGGLARLILGIRVELEGREHLDTYAPCIYVGNHQSGLDVLTFGANPPDGCVTVGKQEIIYLPIFGQLYYLTGNILINRKKGSQAISRINRVNRAIVKRNICIGVYPEGTRNRKGVGMLPFKKGAFFMAKDAGVKVVPYVSGPLNHIYDKSKRRWNGGLVRMRLLAPIDVSQIPKDQMGALAVQVRQQMLDAYVDLGGQRGEN